MTANPHTSRNAPTPSRRILTLDGGGVRGLSSLLILRDLMQRLERRKGHLVRPCDCFDLIIGTGMGGISALFLGRLGMTVDEAINEYMGVAERAFRPTLSRRFIYQRALLDGNVLEDCIADIVQKHLGDPDAILEDLSSNPTGCHTAVLASRKAISDAPPAVFRSYALDSFPPSVFAICEIARATTAVAGVFTPAVLGSPPVEFMDAGLAGFNNPADIALEEMARLWPESQTDCFVSLGTGLQRIVSLDKTWSDVAEASRRILLSCEFVHDRMIQRHLLKGFGYFRFNVNRGLDSVDIAEWRKVEILTSTTNAWMHWAEINNHLESCVQVLTAERLASGPTAGTLSGQHGLKTLPQDLRKSFETLSSASGLHHALQEKRAQIKWLLDSCCNIMLDVIISKQNGHGDPGPLLESARIASLDSVCISTTQAVNHLASNGFAWSLLHRKEIEEGIKSAVSRVFDVLDKSQSIADLDLQQLRDDIAAARKRDQLEMQSKLDKLSQSDEKILAALQENGRKPRSPEELLTAFSKHDTKRAAGIANPEEVFIHKASSALQRLSKPRASLTVPPWNLTSLEVSVDRTEHSRLGRGGFGCVYKGEWNGSPVAVKEMHRDDARALDTRQIKSIRTEVVIWSRLAHPHVLQFYGASLEASQPFIVSKYCGNGNALQFLRVHPDADRTRIIYEISLAMEYLHSQDVIHADIKALNVLIGDEGQALLADFGISRLQENIASTRNHTKTSSETEGTLRWMAPERLSGRSFGKPSDVYSFAIMVWELFTDEVPFSGVNELVLSHVVVDNKERPPRPDAIKNDGLWELMVRCWDSVPSSRPSFPAIHAMLDSVLSAEGPTADDFTKALVKSLSTTEGEKVESAMQEIPDMTPLNVAPSLQPVPVRPTHMYPLRVYSTALDEIPSEFRVGRSQTTPFVTGFTVFAHLRLLGAFHSLERSVSVTISDPNDPADPLGAVCWRVFIQQAVWRFEIWLKRVVKPRGVSGGRLKREEIPPLDVLLVWHSYLLNPRVYADDTRRIHPELAALGGLPLEQIATQINPATLKFQPTLAQAVLWENMTLAPPEPLSLSLSSCDKLAIECPRCGGPPVQVAWLREPRLASGDRTVGIGWCQNDFRAKCPSCLFKITRESIAVGRFATDIAVAMVDKNAVLPGTLFDPIKSTASTAQAQLITTLLLQPFVDLPPIQQAIGEHVGWSFSGIERIVTEARELVGIVRDRRSSAVKNDLDEMVLPTLSGTEALRRRIIAAQAKVEFNVDGTWRFFGHRIAKMLASYRDNPAPFSIDLVGAIIRQTSFTSKVFTLGWLDPYSPNPPLAQSITRYHNYLHLLSRFPYCFLVPTLDIDLGWHTHQLSGASYMSDTKRCTGTYVDHDDKVEEGLLSDGFDMTTYLWKETFQEAYSSCEPLQRAPIEKIKKLGRYFSSSSNRPAAPPDLTTFPSEHPSTVVFHDERITASRSKRERKRAKRKPLGTDEEPFLRCVHSVQGVLPKPLPGVVTFEAMGLSGWALLGDLDQNVLDANTVEKGQCCSGYPMAGCSARGFITGGDGDVEEAFD